MNHTKLVSLILMHGTFVVTRSLYKSNAYVFNNIQSVPLNWTKPISCVRMRGTFVVTRSLYNKLNAQVINKGLAKGVL